MDKQHTPGGGAAGVPGPLGLSATSVIVSRATGRFELGIACFLAPGGTPCEGSVRGGGYFEGAYPRRVVDEAAACDVCGAVYTLEWWEGDNVVNATEPEGGA
jgi:hypothetical protein